MLIHTLIKFIMTKKNDHSNDLKQSFSLISALQNISSSVHRIGELICFIDVQIYKSKEKYYINEQIELKSLTHLTKSYKYRYINYVKIVSDY